MTYVLRFFFILEYSSAFTAAGRCLWCWFCCGCGHSQSEIRNFLNWKFWEEIFSNKSRTCNNSVLMSFEEFSKILNGLENQMYKCIWIRNLFQIAQIGFKVKFDTHIKNTMSIRLQIKLIKCIPDWTASLDRSLEIRLIAMKFRSDILIFPNLFA